MNSYGSKINEHNVSVCFIPPKGIIGWERNTQRVSAKELLSWELFGVWKSWSLSWDPHLKPILFIYWQNWYSLICLFVLSPFNEIAKYVFCLKIINHHSIGDWKTDFGAWNRYLLQLRDGNFIPVLLFQCGLCTKKSSHAFVFFEKTLQKQNK